MGLIEILSLLRNVSGGMELGRTRVNELLMQVTIFGI